MSEQLDYWGRLRRAKELLEMSQNKEKDALYHGLRAGNAATLFLVGLLFLASDDLQVRGPAEGASALAILLTAVEINEQRKSRRAARLLDTERERLLDGYFSEGKE